MSEQQPEAIELPPSGDAAFSALMGILVDEEPGAPAGTTAGTEAGAAAAADGAAAGAAAGGGAESPAAGGGATPVAGEVPVAGGQPAAGAPDAAGRSAGGDQGAPAGGAAGDAAGPVGGDLPAGWNAEPAALIPKLGELSTAIETRTAESYKAAALEEVRTEHGEYFKRLEMHPRMLVGQQVPAIGKEGMETLQNTQDARDWQDAVKQILGEEVTSRATTAAEESADFLQTVHSSIELFQNNTDLIPGTKTFDRELADRFTTLLKPYELRVDGKLQGYSIPVQPIVDSVRGQLKAERAAKAPAPAAPSPAAGADQKRDDQGRYVADAPQAGIASKAGSGGQAEDFSTLFGTIGLPNLQI